MVGGTNSLAHSRRFGQLGGMWIGAGLGWSSRTVKWKPIHKNVGTAQEETWVLGVWSRFYRPWTPQLPASLTEDDEREPLSCPNRVHFALCSCLPFNQWQLKRILIDTSAVPRASLLLASALWFYHPLVNPRLSALYISTHCQGPTPMPSMSD